MILKGQKETFSKAWSLLFSHIYTSLFPNLIWPMLLSGYFIDSFGALSLSLFTKMFSWTCLALISFIQETSEKWEMENHVLLATFLDTLDSSVKWRCFLMEQKTACGKAGLMKKQLFPYSRTKTVTNRDLTINTYFNGFLSLFTTLAYKTRNVEILIRLVT